MLQKLRDQTQSFGFKVLAGVMIFVLAVFGFGAFNLFVNSDPEVASVNGEEITHFIDEVTAIRNNYGFQTEIIVAAARNARQIVNSAVTGADIVTAGMPVFQESFDHPYTDVGLGKFQSFWDETPYE